MTREKNLKTLPTKFFHFLEEWNDKRLLDFFSKDYEWVCKNWGDSTYWTMTLTEIIDSDKEFVRNNPKLFDKDFLRIIHTFNDDTI